MQSDEGSQQEHASFYDERGSSGGGAFARGDALEVEIVDYH
jgi:hypothetical protein